MTTNYLVWSLLKPSQLILLSAAIGVVFWRTIVGRACRSVAAVLIIVFGLLPTSTLLLRPLETRFSVASDLQSLEGIIVMAGGEDASLTDVYDEPQLNSRGDRVTTFLILANQFPEARLAHTGMAETGAAQMILLGSGIDTERIHFDDQSRNTCESARRLKGALRPRPSESWLVVTSGFHMPRVVACFRAIDWSIKTYPTDLRSTANPFYYGLVINLENLDLAAHEWLGLIYYRLSNVTDELFPAESR